jgi:non-specific serine/threonine protein kinase
MLRTSASPSRSHNLPALLSSFVGRKAEIADVRRLLRTQRLVTLTGPGGCGKTRLALQVASDALPEFEDGAWLIELGSLADPTLVPQTVASALGVREQSGRPLTDTLADYLCSRRALLLLDNCEHLVEACAQLAAALLQACPTLTILATSREPLGVDGETVWKVPTLSLPHLPLTKGAARGDAPPAGQPLSEAVQLFLARAEAASPGFALTSENAAAVEDICRRLDGLPLAIELAAARLRALTVHEVGEHLDDRFHLLTGGNRMAPERHQTLEATLDWSYALLSETERKVLQRLSVFAGGCTLLAAESVCSGDDLAVAEILDALTHLVDKSLLRAREQDEGGMRYRLLETIRQYAWRRLQESPDRRAVESRHAQMCLALAKQGVMAESKFPFVVQVAAVHQLEAEHDNFRAALAWSLSESGDRELGLRLSSTLAQFWQMRGYLSEGRAWRDALLTGAEAVPAAARAEAWSFAGHALIYSDHIEEGAACFEKSLALYEELADEAGAAWQRSWLGWVSVARGNYADAASLAGEAAKTLRQFGDNLGAAVALEGWGEAEYLQGNYVLARKVFEESLGLAGELGNPYIAGRRQTRLGQVAHAEGKDQEALPLIEQAMAICIDAGDNSGATMALVALATIGVAQGNGIWAAKLLGAVADLREQAGSSLWYLDRLEYERSVEKVRSEIEAPVFEAAWADGRGMTLQQAVEHAHNRPGTAVTRRSLKEEFGGLTAREREVAAWIAAGKSNRDISEAMTVGVRTVETYVTRILSKLGLDSRVQIATWAVEKGLQQKERR